MNRFQSLDELRFFLRKDRDEASLCPLRFINVDTMEMWVAVKKVLLSMSRKYICLSSFCAGEDTTPNLRRFTASIRTTTETICVSPLSEYLRVKPDIAKSTIEELLATEYIGNTEGKLRIYVPMYRMKSILQTVPDSDPRKKDCLLFLNTGEESDYSLTVVQKELQVKTSGNEISGFKQYLQYWEQNPDKPLILHTENAIHFGQSIFFDNVKVIITSFDLLHSHYNLPTVYTASFGTGEQWDRLVERVSEEQSFENACCSELLINKYTPQLYENWSRLSAYQRWLLWLWGKSKQTSGYLGICIESSVDVDDLIRLLYCKLEEYLESPEYDTLYAQRKNIISKSGIAAPPEFWSRLQGMSVVNRLRMLTDCSAKERECIFKNLKEISGEKRSDVKVLLRNIYPALGNYISAAQKDIIEDFPVAFDDYFFEYRWNKAANIIPISFLNVVDQVAKQRGAEVYETKARNLVVSEEYDDASTIIFVDGMGVEYSNYLSAVLKPLESDGYRIRFRSGYCNLPSTTEINKDFLTNRRVAASFLELDEMKHGGSQYPRTIEQELAFIDTLREKVRDAFVNGISRVILTSDHGTSRMAVLVRKSEYDKKVDSEGHTIYKYGRYCVGTDLAPKYETAIEYGDKLIFADYTRFEQKGAPIDEIHGGASLEEWIVPVVIIEKADVRKAKIVVKIIGPTEPLRPDSMTNMVPVKFSLNTYNGNDVTVRVHGKKIVCKHIDDGQTYEFKYKPDKTETSITTKVYVGNDSVGEFTFAVKKSITQNKKFDL